MADGPERRRQSSVLQEAFDVVHSELQAVLQGGDRRGSVEDERAMSLLEKYSEQLVQMTQKKLNQI